MNKLLSIALSAALLAGCSTETPPAQTIVREADGSTMSVTLPHGLSAEELIQLRGMTDAALTIRAAQHDAEAQLAADRQKHDANLAAARQVTAAASTARREWMAFVIIGSSVWATATAVIGCFALHCLTRRRP